MDSLVIEGGQRLEGRIPISGSKNAALPILLAAPLVDGQIIYQRVPELMDIRTTTKLLSLLGCEVEQEGKEVRVTPGNLTPEAPYELVRTMRASVLCLGPLLARLGEASVALPGGCAIGARPVDLHLKALERMGAEFELEGGYIRGRCKRLKGARIQFDMPTVGGTENLLMAAATAEGETVLENAAREPEVVDLANFLNFCGAQISGHGTAVIRIHGVNSLSGCRYRIMPDRIEAGTYMCAAAITRGDVKLRDCPMYEMEAIVAKLSDMGVAFEQDGDDVRVWVPGDLNCVDVRTQPFPGFPTDMQAQVMALMCRSEGMGVIEETIFENRFMHVLELARMGAHITLTGRSAMVRGVERLVGAPVMASDLRASASLVVAGLVADKTTTVQRIYHLDRGYEVMEEKLQAVGARIRRVREQ